MVLAQLLLPGIAGKIFCPGNLSLPTCDTEWDNRVDAMGGPLVALVAWASLAGAGVQGQRGIVKFVSEPGEWVKITEEDAFGPHKAPLTSVGR